MKRACVLTMVLAAALLRPAHADDNHRFGFIGHSLSRGGEKQLRQALKESSEPSLAFVVIAGIKSDKEGLYRQAV